ncbi:uncharacterized protein EV154DRAFT_74322 [Mucor mucedo]|uniref:uncharacterized protein n=1 Tax=Mucor mucedo TaxID=29922 RepID=UPI00221EAB22|nr:uncharacterized protein EV154DRAFT_74322 [Mucor mucedo]KAI7875827.1 hypothetical protein EV154DRAFT_74322 [Mucor mucedo]
MNEEGQVQQMEDIECDIPALDGFITQSEIHQKLILQITDGMMMQLQRIFKDSLKMHSKYGKQDKREGSLNDYLRMETSKNYLKEIRDLLTLSKSNLLEQLMENIKLDTFFIMDDKSCNTNNNLVTTCQPEHMFFFMLIYFYNLGKQLEDKIGNKWRDKSIWYGVCIDKNLLDTMFGSTKKLEKLFFASGILRKDNNFIKAKFCIRGEEILPAIQQKFEDLNFKMKSYFVVAQIFEKHVQLTMHQIVKLESSGSDSASIVIQDKIIYINDVYDTLVKKIWMRMQRNYQIDFCTTHMQNKNTKNDFGSIQKCGYMRQNLKSCVVKLLKRNRDKLDMNSTIKLNIDDKCDCNIDIFLCNVIEVGLKSVMEEIAAVIAASLSNKEIFGNYETDYLFMSGDPFNLSYGSLIYNAYTMVAQQAIDDSIKLNQRDTQGFILRESFRKLLKPNTHNKPYMYDRFITGTLCQVSSKTHAVRFSSLYGAIKVEEIPRDQPLAEIISVENSKGVQSEKYNLLDKHTTGVRHEIHTGRQKRSTHKFKVEYRRLQYNCSYELSARVMGYDVDYNETLYEEFVNMIEPLTLKYI